MNQAVRLSLSTSDIRQAEIIPKIKQRLSPRDCQGIGKAIAEVKLCRVTSLAVFEKRLSSSSCMSAGDRDNKDL